MTIIKQRYLLIPSKDIDDQRILQSDGTSVTTDYTQPKVVVSDATFFYDTLNAKNLRDQLIHSSDIDDQRILQSDCLRVF